MALSLAREKLRVGLLDADLFGPSIPRMMNLLEDSSRPVLNTENKIIPVLSYGIECMSMGLVQPKDGKSIVWRGLMVQKAIEQLLFQVQWHNLDYLVVDLPPGTGDTQLTLCQKVPINGIVLASTPQEVSISDTRKAADMFKTLNIPIIGLINNMSSFICPHCKEDSSIFNTSRTNSSINEFAKSIDVPILAEIPIDPIICSGSDDGRPIVLSNPEHLISRRFRDMAQFIIKKAY